MQIYFNEIYNPIDAALLLIPINYSFIIQLENEKLPIPSSSLEVFLCVKLFKFRPISIFFDPDFVVILEC